MLYSKKLLIGTLLVSAVSLGYVEDASAQRRMLVLIDQSGSMGTLRASDGRTRFQAAVDLAQQRVSQLSFVAPDLQVAVFTFRSASTAIAHTPGFVPPAQATTAIAGLPGPGGNTPLAGGICDAIDLLITAAPPGQRILYVGSDGLENSTPSTNACFGPNSSIDIPPFSPGSWQNLTFLRAITNVVVQVDVFNSTLIINSFLGRWDSEMKAPSKAFGVQGAPTLVQFMSALADNSGGTLVQVPDNMPLPVVGDYNGDGCVDFDDSTEFVQSIGLSVPPADVIYDLDGDGQITFEDYIGWSSTVGNGCP